MIDKFYKMNGDKKQFYVNNTLIGQEFDMVKWLISNERISSSKAHKEVGKIREYKEKK
jgi:hypothetical protein